MIIREETKLDNVARAIFETIFDGRWSDLGESSIERAIYRDAARMALMTGAEWDITHPPEPGTEIIRTTRPEPTELPRKERP